MAETDIGKARLEAFSDGVIAIIVTIMVLELKPPHAPTPDAILALWPTFAAYAVSFAFVAIYWVNHRHLLQRARRIDNRILWLNMVLLFWLSLIPFATAYLGVNLTEAFPVALYSGLFLVCAISFMLLARSVAYHHGNDPAARAMDRAAGRKNAISLSLYAIAIPAAYLITWVSLGLVLAVGALYFIPEVWLEGSDTGEESEAKKKRRPKPPQFI